MKIRIKTWIALIITMLCLIAMLHFVSESIILSNFKQLEQNQVSNIVGQVQVALTDELNRYQNRVVTWAQMDNVTSFLEQQEQSFDNSNKAIAAWVDLGVNYLLAYDKTGNYLTGFGFNLNSYQKEPVPKSLIDEIKATPVIWEQTNVDSLTSGIILIPTGALIVASSPISSNKVGEPAVSTLIMARFLDSEETAALSRTVQLPITITTYDQATLNKEANGIALNTYSEPVNDTYIVGYYAFKDLKNNPILLIGVTIPRSIYVQGVITVNYIDRLVLISGVVFSVTIALLLEVSYLSKLSKLTDEVSKIGQQNNNQSKRLRTSGNDEIESLKKSINGMLGKIEDNTIRLQKVERFSAIGELATMVAHDLRNPLQGIALAAYYLKRKTSSLTSESDKQIIAQIDEDVRYSDKIINDLLDYSREIRLDLANTTPRSTLWKALSIAYIPDKIVLIDELTDLPTIKVDVDSIIRVFINMINNAVDAMPNGGQLKISCKPEGQMACFQFSDTGEGIGSENMKNLFQPLFTTKAKGMGFGLSICKRIVEAHSGKIVVQSVVSKGTTFSIYLPLAT